MDPSWPLVAGLVAQRDCELVLRALRTTLAFTDVMGVGLTGLSLPEQHAKHARQLSDEIEMAHATSPNCCGAAKISSIVTITRPSFTGGPRRIR